ncbi:MAG: hypothetical protein Q9228_001519 [Teloschistes exilis]
MVNINEETIHIQNSILALKVFGHEGYTSALDALERWIRDQRERLSPTQEDFASTTAIAHDFESAGSPTTISPWSLHRDPTRVIEFPEIPGDSLSGEMYDILNLPPSEGHSRIDQSDSLFIGSEQRSIDEDSISLSSENVQAGPNSPSVPPVNSCGGSWSDIMETSPNINPVQNATAGLSDGRHKSDDTGTTGDFTGASASEKKSALTDNSGRSIHSDVNHLNPTDDSSGASTGNGSSGTTDISSRASNRSVHSDISHLNATDNSSQASANDTDNDATHASSRVSARDSSLELLVPDTSNRFGGKESDSAGSDTLTALCKKAQDTFVQSRLDFPCGETVITVNPEEVNDFFSQFTKDRMLTTSTINSIIPSFAWDAATLVLHSRYMEVEETERAPERTERQSWPIAKTYEQVIIPSCYKGHWTLFQIKLDERLVWHYDSARSQSGLSQNLKEVIKHGLKCRISEGEIDVSLEFKEAESPGQRNEYDCGLYTILNAERLSRSLPSMEIKDGLVLRQRYLQGLFEYALWGRHHQTIQNIICDDRRPVKRLHVAEEAEDPEEAPTAHESKRARSSQWEPFSRLGKSEADCETLRNRLARRISCGDTDQVKTRQRADHLMKMMGAIGGQEVVTALENTLEATQEINKAPMKPCPAVSIYNLLSRGQDRSHRDHIILRLGKYLFASRIADRVRFLRSQGAPSKQKVAIAGSTGTGNAVTRALWDFLDDVYAGTRRTAGDPELRKCKQWWTEGKVWRLLAGAVDPVILLLIPSGQKSFDEQRIWDSE